LFTRSMWLDSRAMTAPSQLSIDLGFSLVVGKVSLYSTQLSSTRAVTTINHREAVESHRSSMLLSGWTCRCISVLFVFPSIQRLCLPRKQGRASKSIRHQVRVCTDDIHHLIVHECSGIGPGDAQSARGLRAIRSFTSNSVKP
jgi:hypothetical protein